MQPVPSEPEDEGTTSPALMIAETLGGEDSYWGFSTEPKDNGYVTLLESLLDAIIRLDGEALVMHVGEKP